MYCGTLRCPLPCRQPRRLPFRRSPVHMVSSRFTAKSRSSLCRALSLRNDLLPGFAEAVAEFEDWVPLLVLRAAQALGLFTSPGGAATAEQLRRAGGIIPQYSRFTAEMLAILQRAGKQPLHSRFGGCKPLDHLTACLLETLRFLWQQQIATSCRSLMRDTAYRCPPKHK